MECTQHVASQITPFIGGIYGTTLATMGMLAVMGMVLALDGFGPIADNAAGIAEMSGEGGAEETMEALRRSWKHNKSINKRICTRLSLTCGATAIPNICFRSYSTHRQTLCRGHL